MLHKLVLQHNLYTIEKLQFKTRSEGLISLGQLPSKIFIFQSRARAHDPSIILRSFEANSELVLVKREKGGFLEIHWHSLKFCEIH